MNHASLAARLETIASDHPQEIRRLVVEAVREAVPNNVGSFFCTAFDDDQPCYGIYVIEGDPDVTEWLGKLSNQPVRQCAWMPPHIDPRIVDNFVRVRSFYRPEYLESLEILRVFEPIDTGDQLRAVLFDGPRFLGWIGLLRQGRDERFLESEEKVLQRVLGPIKAALAAADALEDQMYAAGISAVYTPDGRVEHASLAFRRWLDPDRAAHLQRRVSATDRGLRRPGLELMDGAEARVVRLDGSQGVRYMVTIDRAEMLRLSPEYRLTPRQREVAHFAVAGATNAEIADALGISLETVKSHLANIYERLHVASRVELAAVFGHDS